MWHPIEKHPEGTIPFRNRDRELTESKMNEKSPSPSRSPTIEIDSNNLVSLDPKRRCSHQRTIGISNSSLSVPTDRFSATTKAVPFSSPPGPCCRIGNRHGDCLCRCRGRRKTTSLVGAPAVGSKTSTNAHPDHNPPQDGFRDGYPHAL